MDELLPREAMPASAGKALRLPVPADWGSGARGAARRLREGAAAAREGLLRSVEAARAAMDRHPVSPLLYATLAAVAAGTLLFQSTYVKAYAVQVDGVEVGVVASAGQVEAAITGLESRVSQVVDGYTYEGDVVCTPVYATEDTLTDAAHLENYLYATAGAVVDGYALTVDGVEMGASATRSDLQALLDRVSAQYRNENTVDYGFVETVAIQDKQLPADAELDAEAAFSALTANRIEQSTYLVQKGDTFGRIAQNLGLTVDQLSELNPDVVIDKIWVDQALVIQQAVPLLSVWTVENVTYEQAIESPIEYTDTDSMYTGETRVTQQGEDGVASVNAEVRCVNGNQVEQNILSTTVIQEPVATKILRGTKVKPRTASTGSYNWPVSGTISSRYGYRHGEFHTGLDIACPSGSTIKAADGGTVTFAGWKGNYGYLVIITHDSGAQTYYAHNSSLLVSAGDKVYQGQAIAKSGSTGRSTGPHCHFEIRVGGKTQNPLNYL